MSLKIKAISGVKWTTISTVVVAILQLLQLSILTRFLNPSDFGSMALVMVVIGFSQAFLDMGISNAIIYKQEISHEQLSTLYWVNVLSGFIVFVITVLISPLVSIFYGEPELKKLIIIVGITFIIQPFGQQFMILWQKEMRFRGIAKIDIITKTVSLFFSTFLAYKGFGVYALVYGRILAVTCQTALYVFNGLNEHRPSFIFKINNIGEFLSFGLYQMGEKTINYFNSQFDTILIGKLIGLEALGIYNIAKQLILKPIDIIGPIITKVTFPTMAKIQNEKTRLKNIYLKTLNYLSSVILPIYILLIILAPEIILLLFGKKWLEAIPILQILSVYGILRSIGSPVGSLLLAKGKANWGFWWNFFFLFYVPIGIYISSYWGMIGISWGLVIMAISGTIPNWFFLVRPLCGAKFIEYHLSYLLPLTISSIVFILLFLLKYFLEFSPIVNTIYISILSFIMFTFLNRWLNNQFYEDLFSLYRK